MNRWQRTELPPPSIKPRTCEDCAAPLQGWWVDVVDRRQGARRVWVWGTCGCRDPDEGRRHVTDNSLQDDLGEPHDLEGRR